MSEARAELPRGWEWCALEDVAQVRLGRQRSPKNHTGPNMVPYLRAANVTWSGLDLSDVKEMHFSEDEQTLYALEPGDLLVSEASGSATEVGKPAIWRDEIPGACLQNTLLRVRSEGPMPEYLLLVLREAAVSGRFGQASLGVGINHLGRERLATWAIPLPPLPEQERILERVDSVLGLVEAGLNDAKLAAGDLDRMRAAILFQAVTGQLTGHGSTGGADQLLTVILERRRAAWESSHEAKLRAADRLPGNDSWKNKYKAPLEPEPPVGVELPADWAWATVDQLSLAVQYGSSAKTSDDDQKAVPVLRMGNIVGGRLDVAKLKYLPASHAEFPELLLRDGDMLFNRTNSPELVGKSAVYRRDLEPCSFASYLIRVRFVEGVVPEYVALCINSPFGRRWIRSVTSQQVGQANVNGSKLRALTLPLPPLEVQGAIVAAVQRQLDATVELSQSLEAARRFSNVLLRSVLATACAGGLSERRPDDKPASLMIAKIAEARIARAAATKAASAAKKHRVTVSAG